MSYTKYERSKYIKLKMHHLILLDLGREKITAIQAGDIYDLMSGIETAGTTHRQELAKNKFYIRAVKDWIRAKKIHRERIAKSKTF